MIKKNDLYCELSSIHSNACIQLRKRAEKAVTECLMWLDYNQYSELEVTEYLNLRLEANGIHDYWYPAGSQTDEGELQKGCIVLFDTENYSKRTEFSNARMVTPSPDNRWTGLGYFYVSPFDVIEHKEKYYIGVWGDFAITVYMGDDKNIKKEFLKAWKLSSAITDFLCSSSGCNSIISKVYDRYLRYSEELRMRNCAFSITGPRSAQCDTNIGHNFPLVYADCQTKNKWIKEISRTKRVFLDSTSNAPIKGHLWTLESRDRSDDYPYGAVSFHQLIDATTNEPNLVTDFLDIFRKINMEWIYR